MVRDQTGKEYISSLSEFVLKADAPKQKAAKQFLEQGLVRRWASLSSSRNLEPKMILTPPLEGTYMGIKLSSKWLFPFGHHNNAVFMVMQVCIKKAIDMVKYGVCVYFVLFF